MKLDFRDSSGDVSLDDTIKLVPCSCCGIHRIALPVTFDDASAFVFCDECREDLSAVGAVSLERAS